MKRLPVRKPEKTIVRDVSGDYCIEEMLPAQAGVYALHGPDNIICYVGKSTCIRSRILTHCVGPRAGQFSRYSFVCLNEYLKRMNFFDGTAYLNWVEAWEIKRSMPVWNKAFPCLEMIQCRMSPALLRFARLVAGGGRPQDSDFEALQAGAPGHDKVCVKIAAND